MALYLKVQGDSFGLPDGQLTDLERMQVPLTYIFSFLSVMFGLVFFYLSGNQPKIKETILVQGSTAAYLAILLIYITINFWMQMSFDHGQGG